MHLKFVIQIIIKLPSLPTTNRMSAIKSLLNIAALRSRTVDLVACQFGSPVSIGLNEL